MAIKVGSSDSGGYSPGAYYKASQPATIDVNNKIALLNWCNILGISEKDLLAAVKEYGPRVRDIRKGLREAQENKAA